MRALRGVQANAKGATDEETLLFGADDQESVVSQSESASITFSICSL